MSARSTLSEEDELAPVATPTTPARHVIAGVAAALALVALLGANWYSLDIDDSIANSIGGPSTASASAWQAFDGADVALALLASLAALALLVGGLMAAAAALVAALAAAGLVVYHLINLPEEGLVAGTISIEIGAWLALAATLVLAAAAALELRKVIAGIS